MNANGKLIKPGTLFFPNSSGIVREEEAVVSNLFVHIRRGEHLAPTIIIVGFDYSQVWYLLGFENMQDGFATDEEMPLPECFHATMDALRPWSGEFQGYVKCLVGVTKTGLTLAVDQAEPKLPPKGFIGMELSPKRLVAEFAFSDAKSLDDFEERLGTCIAESVRKRFEVFFSRCLHVMRQRNVADKKIEVRGFSEAFAKTYGDMFGCLA